LISQSAARPSGSPSKARRLVLVAGGSPEVHLALATLLQDRGVAIEPVADASTALSAMLMRGPDAVVLVESPQFDAVAAYRRVRFHAATVRTPLAVVTSAPRTDDAGAPPAEDTVPAAAGADGIAGWLRRRLPGTATLEEQLRLTLARTTNDGPPAQEATHEAAPGWSPLFDHLADGAAIVDTRGRVVTANAAFAAALGLPSADACRDQHLLALLPSPPAAADDADGGPPVLTVTAAHDGDTVPLDLTFTAAGPQARGQVLVTLRNQRWREVARAALQHNHELTEQLRRSQKIGALGRLAAGVAHDFNNLLQVIGGYAEALGTEALDAAARRRLLQRVQDATDRAASLTRQLLAFGRRQVLVPEVVDLNVTVQALEPMLTRAIGEDVHVACSLAADVQRVRVDPGQIEQVLLNLALNARDAMAVGGTLGIATANFPLDAPWTHPALPVPVPPGDWVLLSVTDTGCGMDADTAAQAFEPFFTTKDPSRGSGLGLSMVYGIVKQSGGFTWIDSTPGAGTSIHVLLPAVAEAASPVPDKPPAARRTAAAGGRILLVEDDPEVRALFGAFLRDDGYLVVEAGDGDDALRAFERAGGDIDVVMTDVVMPHVSGPALVGALRARKLDLRVLYVSGYTDELEIDARDPLAVYVTKPVTRSALLHHVGTLLGRTARV
jgi:signal transduction histidine kinase/DNA-binding response OmpR family regulator